MKAISLWQPWATLIALGVKRCETRSWSTSYRGLLAIHAAKRPVHPGEITGPIATALRRHDLTPQHLPLGAVLCIVRLVDVLPVEQVLRMAEADPGVYEEELHFGNYQAERYAWQLELVRVAPEPVAVKGAQGLWDWNWKASRA